MVAAGAGELPGLTPHSHQRDSHVLYRRPPGGGPGNPEWRPGRQLRTGSVSGLRFAHSQGQAAGGVDASQYSARPLARVPTADVDHVLPGVSAAPGVAAARNDPRGAKDNRSTQASTAPGLDAGEFARRASRTT